MRQPLQCDIDGHPFAECIQCHADLLNEPTPYYVERAQKRVGDTDLVNTVFEYAICVDCAMALFQEMSTESREAIEGFMQEHTPSEPEPTPEDGLPDHCLLSGRAVEDLQEWTECGMFVQGRPSTTVAPYMVSGEMTDELMMLLSDETIDLLDDFKERNLDLPPELKELFDKKPVLLPL